MSPFLRRACVDPVAHGTSVASRTGGGEACFGCWSLRDPLLPIFAAGYPLVILDSFIVVRRWFEVFCRVWPKGVGRRHRRC